MAPPPLKKHHTIRNIRAHYKSTAAFLGYEQKKKIKDCPCMNNEDPKHQKQ